ncbi:MAG: hypothetical protein WC342_01785 [Methanoregula sp.]|jgi:hypothetical protein
MKSSTEFAGIIVLVMALVAAPAAAGPAFVSSSPQTIAEGDAFTIAGTGATNGSVAVMAFGRNYFHTFAATPDSQGNYSIALSSSDTRAFQSGQYAFVILDPGADRQFEIAGTVSGTGNISITDRGVPVADLGPVRDLGPGVQPAVAVLLEVSKRPGIDDIVTPEFFFVELPFIRFSGMTDPATGLLVPDRSTDGRLLFAGTTNMGTENTLTAEIYNLTTGTHVISVPVSAIVPGTGAEPAINKVMNSWTFELDPSRLEPGEYYVDVGWQKEKTAGHGTVLFIVPAEGPAHPPSSGLRSVFQLFACDISLPDKGTLSLRGVR